MMIIIIIVIIIVMMITSGIREVPKSHTIIRRIRLQYDLLLLPLFIITHIVILLSYSYSQPRHHCHPTTMMIDPGEDAMQ